MRYTFICIRQEIVFAFDTSSYTEAPLLLLQIAKDVAVVVAISLESTGTRVGHSKAGATSYFIVQIHHSTQTAWYVATLMYTLQDVNAVTKRIHC